MSTDYEDGDDEAQGFARHRQGHRIPLTPVPREQRTKLLLGRSYAAHAAQIAREDHNRIDKTLRVGLIGGLDGAEIARKVIGNANLNGTDGETEVTRQRVARLGLAAIRPPIHRKRRGE